MLRWRLIGLSALHFLQCLGGFTLHKPSPEITESALTALAPATP